MRITDTGGSGLGRRSRSALLALGLLSAFGPISLDLYLPALPAIAGDFAATDATAQLTLSGALAGLAIGQLLAGPLSDRVGRRPPLLVGLVGFAIMSLLCAMAPGVEVLVLARVLQGMCGAAGVVVARAVVRDAFDDASIARVFSLLMLINGLAPVLAPLVGSGLLHVLPWRGLFVVLAAVGAVIGILTVLALPETLPRQARHTGGAAELGRAVRDVSSDRLFRAATGVLVLGSVALFAYISLGSFVLQDRFGLSPSAFGGVFAVNSVGIVLGGRLSALLLRRRDSHRVLGIGLAIMITGSLGMVAAALGGWGLPGLLPALFVAIAAVGLVLPNATALALLRHVRNAGTASALLGCAQYLAGALAGPVVSAAGTSDVTMAVGMAVAAVAAGVLHVTSLRRASARLLSRSSCVQKPVRLRLRQSSPSRRPSAATTASRR